MYVKLVVYKFNSNIKKNLLYYHLNYYYHKLRFYAIRLVGLHKIQLCIA